LELKTLPLFNWVPSIIINSKLKKEDVKFKIENLTGKIVF